MSRSRVGRGEREAVQACWAGHAGELGWVAPVYKVRRCRRTGTAEECGSLAVMSERPVADVWRCITGVNVGVAGESVLVAARSRASSGEVSPGEASVALACSRCRWGLAVACASAVRHGAGVLAPPMGVGSIRRVPPDREGSTRSITSNMVESVPLARVSMVCVSPGTCRLARSARGRTRNRRLAPGVRHRAT